MSDTDIVAEVDRWLALPASLHEATVSHALLQTTRDEIVALRKALHAEMMGRADKWHAFIAEARDEALEEAAQRCDRLGSDYTIPIGADNWTAGCRGCAGRIRALKDKPAG